MYMNDLIVKVMAEYVKRTLGVITRRKPGRKGWQDRAES
jgi:hypothetical protein